MCKYCGIVDCFVHCKRSTNGIHNGDPSTIVQADSIDFIIDINCRFCGQFGSARIDPDDIQWG